MAQSKDNTWSVVIVATNGRGHVLALTRNFNQHDLVLPGGHCSEIEADPQQTALRVLQEETGLSVATCDVLQIAGPIAEWKGEQGQSVYAFRAYHVTGKMRPSKGKPVWVRPKKLFAPGCTFRDKARELLSFMDSEGEEEIDE